MEKLKIVSESVATSKMHLANLLQEILKKASRKDLDFNNLTSLSENNYYLLIAVTRNDFVVVNYQKQNLFYFYA